MGLGSFWDPNEHPRGWHGRFAKKWKVSDALRGILDHFSPRTFQSDSQAGQYAFNQGHRSTRGPFSSVELTRLRKDWDEASDHLRAGDMDPQTKAFDDMMQSHMVPTTEGLIATKTFGPDALGLRPDQLRDGPGGITDLFGTVLGDKAYSAVHLGNDVTAGQHGPGKISMTILVPPGTRAAFPGQSPNDRGFFLDKEQPLLITRVDPDGMGGWRIAAVAEPHPGTGSSEVRQDLNPGRKGVGLTPEERAARLAQPSTMPAPAAPPTAPATEAVMRPESVQAPAVGRTAQQEAARVQRAQAGRQASVNEGNPPIQAPLPTPNPREAPAPAPAAGPTPPTGAPPRNEPIHAPSIGGTGTEGKSASEIANTPPPPEPAAPPTPTPAEQGVSLKDAYLASGIESPAAGPHRAAFNRAYLSAKSPTGHPEQALRNLEKDIQGVEQKAAEQKIHPSDRPDMATAEADAKSMNELADLIATHFGLPRTKKEQPAPASPVKRTGAPDEFLGGKKPGAHEPGGVSGQPSRTTTGLTPHEQAGSGPGTAGVGGRKAGTPETPAPRGSTGKETTQKPTVSAARVQAGDVVLARKNENGEWVHTSTKTGATPITVTRKSPGAGGTHVIEGTDPNGNKVTLNPIRGQNVLHRHQEKAPKAPAAKKAAKAAPKLSSDEIAKRSAEMLARPAGGGGKAPGPLTEADHRSLLEGNSKEQLRKIGEDLGVQVSSKDSKASMIDKNAPAAAADTAKRAAERQAKGAEPNLGARQTADTAGVDRVLKAYNDIVARGNGHDRRVSIADIRAEVGNDLSRAELTRALREIGRGGSTHGGLLSRGVKPDARTEANGMDMGGEKVHFLQLPRPGEAQRGKETTPHAPEAPTPEPVKAVKKAVPKATPKAGPNPEAVAATKKAYEDIVARRGPEGDRKVSLQDIRQELELNHNFSRPEVDAAIKELGRGGSEHGGLISGTNAPSAREKAGGMKMGGEDVHFLQLPRPGEAARGAETTPSAPEAPTPAAPAAAAEKPLEKMTKAELLAHPDAQGAKKSWTKDRILQHIQDHQGTPSATSGLPTGQDTKAREAEVVSRILAAHDELVNRPGGHTSLADLREKVGNDVTRQEFDKAITDISHTSVAQVVPESNQKTLRPQDRAGAIRLGNQDRHLLRVNPGVSAEDLNADISHHQSGGNPTEGPTAKRLAEEQKKLFGARAPRPAAPIDNTPRANEFTKAWDAAGIPEAPGSAGRSMKEIRQDVASGKIDPAEGVRRMESEVSFNKDELSQVEADLRAPDLTDAQRSELQAEHAKLSESIKAQERASEFMRAHFGGQGDKPTVAEVKVQLPHTFGDTLKTAKPEQMDEVARIQGLDPPKGTTAEEKFNDLIRQTIDKALDEKKKASADKAAKAEAARIKKEAREAGKAEFRPGGAKHLDAAKIAEGLGLDENNSYLNDAQAELNDGKTPKQVADRLRFMARGLADSNAIINGSVGAGNETPDDKMHRETRLAEGRAAVAKLEELAKRIEESKRPRKPRTPSTKLTPTDHAAAKEAAKATGTPVSEVRSAMEDAKKADAKLQELGVPTSADELHARAIARASAPFNDAKTAEEAQKAATRMHADLTLAEIRKMGAEHGITGRSKKDITDKIIARRFPPEDPMGLRVLARGGFRNEPSGIVNEHGQPGGFTPPPRPRAAGRVRDASRVPGLSEKNWISGGQFDQLKAGDAIEVHLGGSKTRKDSVAKVDPDGTLHTKGGYKYGPTSDVQVSKAGAPAPTSAATPAKVAKKALPQPQASVSATLAALSNHENPPTREEAHGMIEHLTRGELQQMAKELSVPGASSKSKEQLRNDIVQATVGVRADSKATRDLLTRPREGGFLPIDQEGLPARLAAAKKAAKGTGPAAEPRLSPAAEKARLEQERADNMARLAAAKALPKKAAPKERFTEAAAERQFNPAKASSTPGPRVKEANLNGSREAVTKYGRSNGDEKLFLPNGGGDQSRGGIHFDSEIGKLWQDFAADSRVQNSYLNEVGHIGQDVGQGRLSLPDAATRLRALAERAPDAAVRDRILEMIPKITGPTPKVDLPADTPATIKQWLDKLAEIPTLDMKNPGGAYRRETVLEQGQRLVREIAADPRSVEARQKLRELENITENIHESVDGVYYARTLTPDLDRDAGVRAWLGKPGLQRKE